MTEVKLNESIDLTASKVKRVNNNSQKNQRDKKPQSQTKPQPKVRTDEEICEMLGKTIITVGGKYIKFEDADHTEGLLVAAIKYKNEEIDKYEYAFAIVNKDRHCEYIGANEHFSVLRDIPASLYILDYIYQREPEVISSVVKNEMERTEVEQIAVIKMRTSKQSNSNKNSKNKKNNKNIKTNKK